MEFIEQILFVKAFRVYLKNGFPGILRRKEKLKEARNCASFLRCSPFLELTVLGCAGVGDYVADIVYCSKVDNKAFKAHTETGMVAAAELS